MMLAISFASLLIANHMVTCGGSWMSPADELQVFNEVMTDNINGHPTIGFRIAVTHTGQKRP